MVNGGGIGVMLRGDQGRPGGTGLGGFGECQVAWIEFSGSQ